MNPLRDSISIIPDNYSILHFLEESRVQLDLLRRPSLKHGNGNTLSFIKHSDGSMETPAPIMDEDLFLHQIKQKPDADVYVSVNTFCGKKKTNDSVYACSTLYLDIDIHEANPFADFENSIKEVIDCLNQAYNEETLPLPSFITYTGRGFGVYYLLREAIPWQCDTAVRGKLRFGAVYRELLTVYNQVLSNTCGTADSCVTDPSRLTRLAGTVNSKNGATCRLLFVASSPYYLSLEEIAICLPNRGYVPKNETDAKNQNYRIPNKAFSFYRRLERLEALLDLRKNSMEGYRHTFCFIAYHTALYVETEDKAKARLYRLNQRFSSPLPERELTSIMCHKENLYHFKDTTIMERLGITEEENQTLGFGRPRAKYEAKKFEDLYQVHLEEKYYQIILYMCEHPYLTYQEVGKIFGYKVRNMKYIVHHYGMKKKDFRAFNQKDVCMIYSRILSELEQKREAALFAVEEGADSLDIYNEVNRTMEQSEEKKEVLEEKKGVKTEKKTSGKTEKEVWLDKTDYQFMQKANLAEKIAYANRELGVKDCLFVHWKALLEKENGKYRGEVRHLIGELTHLGGSRLKKFLLFAHENCNSENMAYNLKKVCEYFSVTDIRSLSIVPYPATEKQKEAWKKYYRRPFLLPSSAINYTLFAGF